MTKETSNKVIIGLLSLIIALLVIIYVIPTYTQTDNSQNQQDGADNFSLDDTGQVDDIEIEVEMDKKSDTGDVWEYTAEDFQEKFDELKSIDSYKATSKGGFDITTSYSIMYKEGNLTAELSDISNSDINLEYTEFVKVGDQLYAENIGGFWQEYDKDKLPFITLDDVLEKTDNIEMGLKEDKTDLAKVYWEETPDPDYYFRNEVKVLTPGEFSTIRTLENNIEVILVQGSGYHVSCLHNNDYSNLPENKYGYLDTCLGNRTWFFDSKLNLVSYEENWFESFDEFTLLEANSDSIGEIVAPV